MALEDRDRLARRRVPQPRRLVVRAGHDGRRPARRRHNPVAGRTNAAGRRVLLCARSVSTTRRSRSASRCRSSFCSAAALSSLAARNDVSSGVISGAFSFRRAAQALAPASSSPRSSRSSAAPPPARVRACQRAAASPRRVCSRIHSTSCRRALASRQGAGRRTGPRERRYSSSAAVAPALPSRTRGYPRSGSPACRARPARSTS